MSDRPRFDRYTHWPDRALDWPPVCSAVHCPEQSRTRKLKMTELRQVRFSCYTGEPILVADATLTQACNAFQELSHLVALLIVYMHTPTDPRRHGVTERRQSSKATGQRPSRGDNGFAARTRRVACPSSGAMESVVRL